MNNYYGTYVSAQMPFINYSGCEMLADLDDMENLGLNLIMKKK